MIMKRTLLALIMLCTSLAAQSFCLFGNGNERNDRNYYRMPAIGFSPAWHPSRPYSPVMPGGYQAAGPGILPPVQHPASGLPQHGYMY